MCFEPTVASCYGLHIVGQVHEPESHLIINLIFNENTENHYFIDVGCNIGAFLIDLSRYRNLHLIGFEPSFNCVTAVQKSLELNLVDDAILKQCLVGNENQLFPYEEGNSPNGSSVYSSLAKSSSIMNPMCRLDDKSEI